VSPPLSLRFADPVEEAGFQAYLERALLPVISAGFLAGMWLWPAVAPFLIVIGSPNLALAIVIVLGMFVVNVVTYVLLRRAASLQQVELLGAVTCALSGVSIVALGVVIDVPGLPAYVVPGLIVVTIYAFVVFQLPPGPGLGAAAVYVIAYVFAPIPHASLATVLLDLFLVITAVGLGAMAAYLLERSMRESYRQGRLIEAQSAEIAAERAKSDRLLRNVLPARIAERLREEPGSLAEQFDAATVLFADLVAFTPLAEQLGPERTADMLNALVSRFDDLAERFELEKIKTIGDAYLVVGGVPDRTPDHAIRVVRMGLEMIRATTAYAQECNLPLVVRVGVHSGPVVAGVIGRTKFAYDVWGDTVNVASRLESSGVPGEVQASEATVALLGDDFSIEPRGPLELKGKGTVVAYLVRDLPASATASAVWPSPGLADARPSQEASPPAQLDRFAEQLDRGLQGPVRR
jgi:adenylate cyclase